MKPGTFITKYTKILLITAVICTGIQANRVVGAPAFPLTGTLLFDPTGQTVRGKTFALRNTTAGHMGPPQQIILNSSFTWSRLGFNPEGFHKAGDGPSLAGRFSPDGNYVLLPSNDTVDDWNSVYIVNIHDSSFLKVPGGWFPRYEWSTDNRHFFWLYDISGGNSLGLNQVDAVTGDTEFVHLPPGKQGPPDDPRWMHETDTAVWSHNGKTLVFSRFPSERWEAQKEHLHNVGRFADWRQFFAQDVSGGPVYSLSPVQVDALMGKAYRYALRLCASDAESPIFSLGNGLPPYRLLTAPDGQKVFLWSFGTPNTIRTRWYIVNGDGHKQYDAIPDNVLPYAWSHDSRYVYFLGSDRIVAFDTRAGRGSKVFRLFLRPEWGQLIAFRDNHKS